MLVVSEPSATPEAWLIIVRELLQTKVVCVTVGRTMFIMIMADASLSSFLILHIWQNAKLSEDSIQKGFWQWQMSMKLKKKRGICQVMMFTLSF